MLLWFVSSGESPGTTMVAALVHLLVAFSAAVLAAAGGEQPLSKIGVHRATLAIHPGASVDVSPLLLGLQGQDQEWVTIGFNNPRPSKDDWIGVFSPANFSDSICPSENQWVEAPLLCTAPIKFQYANYTTADYAKTGKGSLRLQIINQRSDISFALFSGGLSNPKLITRSNSITFANPKAPVYPRLAQGKSWDEMTVTWTSGYSTKEATPFVEWGIQGQIQILSPAGTLTFSRDTMCGQ